MSHSNSYLEKNREPWLTDKEVVCPNLQAPLESWRHSIIPTQPPSAYEFHELPFPHLEEEGDDSTPFPQPLGRSTESCL